jgi:tape measure domain-containing protein
MADDTTLIINIQTLLKGLEKTLKGLDALEKKLKSVGATPTPTAGTERILARQRQIRERSDKAEERANIQSFQRRLNALSVAEKQRTAVIEREAKRRQATERTIEQQNLRDFNARIKRLDRAEQTRARAQRAALGAAPQVDAHVRAFRNLEQANTAAAAAASASVARFRALGNSLRSIGQGATTLGFGLTAGLTVPLVAFGKSSLDAAVTLDSLKRGLTAIVGSAEEAATQLSRLTEIAKLPGIGFEEAIQGSIRLQAVGFSAADAEKALIQFSNAVALTGGGRDELARITVQLGQLAAKGKVLAQDLRPIIEAAPAVGKALKNAFGTVNADDIAELTGSSQEFLKVLTAELERLPRAAAGAKNTFENFRDEVFRASAAVGNALIPVLTRLIEVVGPVIIKLADGFSKLPAPLQTLAVIAGALSAALGPALIGLGLLATAAGRAAVGFSTLTTRGIVPSIAALRTFNTTVAATIARLTGLQAATVRAAGPYVALAAALGTLLVALKILNQEEETAVELDLRSAKARSERMRATEEELKFLTGLTGQVTRTKEQENQLAEAYRSVSDEARGRITLVDTEEAKLRTLIEAKKEQLRLDQDATKATAVRAVANFTIALEKRTQAQKELNEAKEAADAVEQERQVRRLAGVINDSTAMLNAQREAALKAAKALTDIGDTDEEIKKAAQAILQLSRDTGTSVDKLIEQAKAANLSEEQIIKLRQAVKDLADEARDAVPDLSAFNTEIRQFNKGLLQGAEAVADEVKRRKALIDANVLLARESSNSFDGALRAMKKFINTQPDLRASIQKEAQLAGKTFEEFVREALGEKADTKGTALRNAQEALADASAKVSQESAEQLIAIEKSKNDELLRENETRFSKELISYREFVEERARLQQVELQGEIDRQKKIAELAAEDVARQQQRAGVVGGAERTRALAAAETSKAKQIEAEIRILDLQSRQQDVVTTTANELREFSKDRERDFRELSRELDEILGKEKAAGEAAVDERFRDTLRDLNNELSRASQIFVEASDAAARSQATADVERINNQIEIINNLKKQLNSVVALRDAQEQINRASERQSNLERDIAFQVEFRGLSERDAVTKRLEGERLVRAEIEKQHAALKEVILTLKRLGLEVPQGLLEGLERFKVAAKGLGESPFGEQFRLAEIELGKVADALADKIADVERAIRSRTISEVEGRLIIRRLNGEYVGELERQLAVLKEIAAASGDEALKRQARSAEQSVKDTRAAADELENFNAQLKSVAVDSFSDSLSQLFKDLRDNTESATQDILNFFNNILNRVNDFIAENLAQRIAESLFPDPNAPKKEGGGFFDTIKGIFGLGGGADPATAANTTATDANTAAINNLTTTFGGQAAGSSAGGAFGGVFGGLLGGGGCTAQGSSGFLNELGGLVSGLGINVGGVLGTSAAAGSTVIEALNINSDWLAKVADALAQNTQALQSQSGQGGGLQGLASMFGGGGEAATGDFISAAPRGRMIRVAEAGYDEAILTTDPKHSMRQAAILREFLKQTRGLYGRFRSIPEDFAEGGFVSARDAEANLLASMPSRTSLAAMVPTAGLAGGSSAPTVNLRNINMIDRREMVRGHLRSAEGAMDILNVISENSDEIGRRIRVR